MGAGKLEAAIFDLDGTIIDSYPGIQQAFDNAYLKVYGVKNTVMIKPLIGPPINEILFKANGETNKETTSSFVAHFKHYYDSENYKSSVLYEDMNVLLEKLRDQNTKLFIATNKREFPTKLIAKYLSIDHLFAGIYCSDTNGTAFSSKGEMVKFLLNKEELDVRKTVLIGDTYQDEIAAKLNRLTFIYAAYGFGELEGIEKTISKPIDTLNFIKEI